MLQMPTKLPVLNGRTGRAPCIFSIRFTPVKEAVLFTIGDDAHSYSIPVWHFPHVCTSPSSAEVGWFWRTRHFVPRSPFDIWEQCINQPASLLRYTRSIRKMKEPHNPAHTPILQDISPCMVCHKGFWEKSFKPNKRLHCLQGRCVQVLN